jgi:UDP-2-acetamido-3-amino-2,3-dideoxy-glucuronate N-acetyltransferase
MSFFKHDKALVSPGAVVGEGTRVWAFANILDGATVGSHCNICDGCFVEKGAKIGNHVTLKNHVAVWDGVTLEDDVFVGAGTAFINDRNPKSNRKDAWVLEKILVKKGASIGANATIMCGVTIGEGAVVGAGAVVLKDVAPHSTVVGNPARPIKS